MIAATCLVRSDVLGTGIMSLSQLDRACASYTGQDPLEGIYAKVADFDGCGAISISDLVAMASLLKD